MVSSGSAHPVLVATICRWYARRWIGRMTGFSKTLGQLGRQTTYRMGRSRLKLKQISNLRAIFERSTRGIAFRNCTVQALTRPRINLAHRYVRKLMKPRRGELF